MVFPTLVVYLSAESERENIIRILSTQDPQVDVSKAVKIPSGYACQVRTAWWFRIAIKCRDAGISVKVFLTKTEGLLSFVEGQRLNSVGMNQFVDQPCSNVVVFAVSSLLRKLISVWVSHPVATVPLISHMSTDFFAVELCSQDASIVVELSIHAFATQGRPLVPTVCVSPILLDSLRELTEPFQQFLVTSAGTSIPNPVVLCSVSSSPNCLFVVPLVAALWFDIAMLIQQAVELHNDSLVGVEQGRKAWVELKSESWTQISLSLAKAPHWIGGLLMPLSNFNGFPKDCYVARCQILLMCVNWNADMQVLSCGKDADCALVRFLNPLHVARVIAESSAFADHVLFRFRSAPARTWSRLSHSAPRSARPVIAIDSTPTRMKDDCFQCYVDELGVPTLKVHVACALTSKNVSTDLNITDTFHEQGGILAEARQTMSSSNGGWGKIAMIKDDFRYSLSHLHSRGRPRPVLTVTLKFDPCSHQLLVNGGNSPTVTLSEVALEDELTFNQVDYWGATKDCNLFSSETESALRLLQTLARCNVDAIDWAFGGDPFSDYVKEMMSPPIIDAEYQREGGHNGYFYRVRLETPPWQGRSSYRLIRALRAFFSVAMNNHIAATWGVALYSGKSEYCSKTEAAALDSTLTAILPDELDELLQLHDGAPVRCKQVMHHAIAAWKNRNSEPLKRRDYEVLFRMLPGSSRLRLSQVAASLGEALDTNGEGALFYEDPCLPWPETTYPAQSVFELSGTSPLRRFEHLLAQFLVLRPPRSEEEKATMKNILKDVAQNRTKQEAAKKLRERVTLLQLLSDANVPPTSKFVILQGFIVEAVETDEKDAMWKVFVPCFSATVMCGQHVPPDGKPKNSLYRLFAEVMILIEGQEWMHQPLSTDPNFQTIELLEKRFVLSPCAKSHRIGGELQARYIVREVTSQEPVHDLTPEASLQERQNHVESLCRFSIATLDDVAELLPRTLAAWQVPIIAQRYGN